MIYDVFTIHDEKAAAFLPPFILPNEAMAKRTFADCVNSDTHQFGANPGDYTLFKIAQFNDHDGTFILKKSKISLGNGVEFRSIDRPRSPELGNGQIPPDESEPQIGNVPPVLSGSSSEDSPE